MLQKLENAYLAILRFVIIAVAGALLVAVAVFGVKGFKVFQNEPVMARKVPHVVEREVVQALNSPPLEATPAPDEAVQQADKTSVFHARSADAIALFVARHSGGAMDVNKFQVMMIIREKAESMGDPVLVAGYAENLSTTIEKILADPSVVAAVQSASAPEVVDRVLNRFTESYRLQAEQAHAEQAERQQAYQAQKAEGQQSLYFAGGAFAAFLMIVFLSIIIRIERNLRHLENKPLMTA